jgi:hypothetical protein
LAKVTCVISIDGTLKERSHQAGLNISKVSENALRFVLSRLEDYNAFLSDKQEFSDSTELVVK